MKKKVTAKEIAFEVSQQNYKKSMKVTNEMVRDLKDYLIMFLTQEQLTFKVFPPSIPGLKSINVDENLMKQCCAAESVKYLVIKYNLGIKKGEDNENNG